jgi:hypothetical protein
MNWPSLSEFISPEVTEIVRLDLDHSICLALILKDPVHITSDFIGPNSDWTVQI